MCSPLQAEAATTLWALQIALEEKWELIIVEGDAKTCIESWVPMSSKGKQVHWSISSALASIECNVAAHASAKLVN